MLTERPLAVVSLRFTEHPTVDQTMDSSGESLPEVSDACETDTNPADHVGNTPVTEQPVTPPATSCRAVDLLPTVRGISSGLETLSLSESDLNSSLDSTASSDESECNFQTSFEDLPDLVVLQIFDYLSLYDKLKVERVCKRWQSYVNVSLRSVTVLDEYLLLRQYPEEKMKSKSLLVHVTNLLGRLTNPETKTTKVRTITVTRPFSILGLHIRGTFFPELRTLTVPNAVWIPPLDMYSSPPTPLQNVRSLYICEDLSSRSLRKIIGALPSLTHLNIGNVSLDENGTDSWDLGDPEAPQSKSLRSLTVQGTGTGLTTPSTFQKIISAFPFLTDLKLWRLDLTDISDDLSYAGDPNGLNLIQSRETHLFDGCVAGAGLSLLSLTINPLPGDAIRLLVDNFPNLQELQFEDYEGVDSFCDLRPLGNLRLLSLDMSDFEIWTFDYIPRILNVILNRTPLSESLQTLKTSWRMRDSDAKLRFDLCGPVLDSISNCHSLRVLHMVLRDGYREKHEDWTVPMRDVFVADNFPHLEDLLLPCLFLDAFGKGDRFDLPHLRRLTLCGCACHQRGDVLRFIGTSLDECPFLEFMGTHYFLIEEDFFSMLAKSLSADRSLEFKVNRPCRMLETCLDDPFLACESEFGSTDVYLRNLNDKAETIGLRVKFSHFWRGCNTKFNLLRKSVVNT